MNRPAFEMVEADIVRFTAAGSFSNALLLYSQLSAAEGVPGDRTPPAPLLLADIKISVRTVGTKHPISRITSCRSRSLPEMPGTGSQAMARSTAARPA